VWTLHDCWSFTGHCAHFVEANCNKWKEQCDNCVLKSKYPKTYFSSAKTNYELKRQLFNSANLTLVPVSEWLSNFVEQSFLKDKAKRVIHNGININTFKPLNTTTNDSINIIGVSSVWNESKGLYDFYKLRNILDPNRFNITLVGLTKPQIDELPKGIVGIERTNSIEELVQVYNDADIFINPTYADTFPTTNLEALACGTPVITYRTGGCPEAITCETGLVVEQGDVNAIVQAIEEICAKGKEYYTYACRKFAVENFDKKVCFEKYIELYSEILNKNK
jgi:glycosyltransferase involved in cell wall biosynthesis